MAPSASCADEPITAIERSIRRGDWMRRSPWRIGGPGHHKEWLHFCVYGSGLDMLINFSVVDDVRPGPIMPAEYARLTLMVREAGWWGEVLAFPRSDVSVVGGDLDLRFGESFVRFAQGRYELRAVSSDGGVLAELELAPISMPSIIHNVQYGNGPPINWLVVPRLVAKGRIRVGERTYPVDGALAYHDHNWGHFGWGRDFAWEWGYGLPDDAANPWSLVFVRLSDRAHTRCMMQGVFLWRGPREQRVFRDREVTVEHRGLRRARRICKVPPVMALVHPDHATDIPAELRFDGRAEGDVVEGRFTTDEVAQVILPNDRDLGVTVINEVSGRLNVAGRIRGEELHVDGRAVFEFLGR